VCIVFGRMARVQLGFGLFALLPCDLDEAGQDVARF
jgi:hypothetical protein